MNHRPAASMLPTSMKSRTALPSGSTLLIICAPLCSPIRGREPSSHFSSRNLHKKKGEGGEQTLKPNMIHHGDGVARPSLQGRRTWFDTSVLKNFRMTMCFWLSVVASDPQLASPKWKFGCLPAGVFADRTGLQIKLDAVPGSMGVILAETDAAVSVGGWSFGNGTVEMQPSGWWCVPVCQHMRMRAWNIAMIYMNLRIYTQMCTHLTRL